MPSGVLLDIFKFLAWNDICQVACTCTKFRDVCQSATLWLHMKKLDFRNCAVPDPEKILHVLEKTPNAEHLILEDVLTDETNSVIDEEEMETQEDNLSASDRFLLSVLKLCPKIVYLDLHMQKISDMSVSAICAKCMELETLEVHGNGKITTEAVCELVSLNPVVKDIVIDSCEEIRFPEIKHTDPQKYLQLKKVSLQGQMILTDNIRTLLGSCPNLRYLDLTAADCLNTFDINRTQGQKCGLDNMEVLILQGCAGLQTVELPYCPNLEELDTSYCGQLTEISATTPRLRKLLIQGCEILKKLDLVSSDLSELQCQNMEHLDTLRVGSNNLHMLDLFNCSRMCTEQILAALTDKGSLTWLNISGCKNISPSDVSDILLEELTGLQTLLYGGHSWNSVRLASKTLKQLEFSSCINTACVLLNMPCLQDLTLSKCRDFMEQEIVDSLLHGQLFRRMQGLETLKTSQTECPAFKDGGVPDLHTLKFHDIPGIRGDVMSHGLSQFQYLSSVEFVHCNFLEHMVLINWPSLQSLKIESCNRLQILTVKGVPTLHILCAKWCSMVERCEVEADNLCNLDVTGTNFASLHISCDKLSILRLSGVCTQPKHSVHLRCRDLRELSISKCDRLTDAAMQDILKNNLNLKSFTLLGSVSVSSLTIPSGLVECSLTGHRVLKQIELQMPINVCSLALNHLPKFSPEKRQKLVDQCKATLKTLELRAIAGETTLSINLPELQSFTLYQGLQLTSLDICCPQLKYLRIQGCPKLCDLTLHTQSVTQVQVYHSPPLLALKNLTLHSKKVVHLARVLAHYCPHLIELSLYNSDIKSSQLYSLGLGLPTLTRIKLHSCSVQDSSVSGDSFIITSAQLGRSNELDLRVVINS